MKLRKNKFMKLKKLLGSFSRKELTEYILKHISVNDANNFKLVK